MSEALSTTCESSHVAILSLRVIPLPLNKFSLNFSRQVFSSVCQKDNLKYKSIQMELLASSFPCLDVLSIFYTSQHHCYLLSYSSPRLTSFFFGLKCLAHCCFVVLECAWHIGDVHPSVTEAFNGTYSLKRQERWGSCTPRWDMLGLSFDLRWNVSFYKSWKKRKEGKGTHRCVIVLLKTWQSLFSVKCETRTAHVGKSDFRLG